MGQRHGAEASREDVLVLTSTGSSLSSVLYAHNDIVPSSIITSIWARETRRCSNVSLLLGGQRLFSCLGNISSLAV